jgi:hypothetical protein
MSDYRQLIDRAWAIARPRMRRPDRGIALPFGIDYPSDLRWRMSPDVRDTIIAGGIGVTEVAVLPEERLLGVLVVVDYKAPADTLELLMVASQ